MSMTAGQIRSALLRAQEHAEQSAQFTTRALEVLAMDGATLGCTVYGVEKRALLLMLSTLVAREAVLLRAKVEQVSAGLAHEAV